MIRANVRRQLTRDDAQLVLRLIARESRAEYDIAEQQLRDSGMDALLDDPRLLVALLEARQGIYASYPLFIYVVVRHALRAVEEHDVVLADYVAALLLHFGLRDRSQKIANVDDQSYATLVALSNDVNSPDARRAFLVRAHLGNYALWLSGLFPDYIDHRRWRRGGPDLEYFEEMGRRGYRLAADHRLAEQNGMTDLYTVASERFERLRMALNGISDRLLFPNVHTPERLMRQVRDEHRWRYHH